MPSVTVCTSCRQQLQVPDEHVGRLVKCPLCGNAFTAAASTVAAPSGVASGPPPLPEDITHNPSQRRGADRETAPPPRRSRARDNDAEEEARYRRRTADDDYDDYDDERRPRRHRDRDADWEDDYDRPRRRRRGPVLDDLSGDYTIELGVWFEHAKEHYTAVLGPMIGYSLLNGLFALPWVIPILGPILALATVLFIDPALNAGYAIVSLAQLRGKRWSFGDFFGGFQWYGSLLGNFWLRIALGIVCMMPSLLVFLIALALAAATRSPRVMWLPLLAAVFNFVPAIYVMVRATCFNVQLIVDRDYGPWEAIQGSWRLTRGHFWGLVGVSLVLALIVMAGVLACFVGVLFAAPFAVLAWNAGYLVITGRSPRRPTRRDYDEDDHYDR